MKVHPKIHKLSGLMSHFCTLLMLIIPASVIWFWINADSQLARLSWAHSDILLDPQYIQSYQIILAAAVNLSIALLIVFGLWNLKKMFTLFRSGVLFELEPAHHLHVFAWVLLASALLKPISTALTSVLLTLGNPPGQASVVVEFGSHELSNILIAGTLLAITWILREGHKLAAENASFV